MMRRVLALLLLGAHALAALHLALAEHARGAAGQAVEAQACHAPEHHDGVTHGHRGEHERDCEVLAWIRAGLASPAAPAAVATLPQRSERLEARPASPPLEVLSVAPKGSPPA